MASRERTYGGSTLSARRAQRRADLAEATLDLVGEGGSPAVTVRSVCRKAGLTDRYFYESFANRDELLTAVFNDVSHEVFGAMADVVSQVKGTRQEKARAAMMAMVAFGDSDPRKMRLLLREPFTDSALIAAGLAEASGLTRLLAHNFPRGENGTQRAMNAISVGGALATLLATWQMGLLRVSVEELVEHCVSLVAPE
ncbi:MAG TPA: TetR/AcrR family transcriptional regulator [Nocardioidaceae bacterium]|nr:TetR/AcrR family transcriptional regulator [Nocardioidaceae bacterium]